MDVTTLLAAAGPLIDLAIAEDIGPGDATSLSTIAPETVLHGRIVAKESGVIAGLPVAEAVFHKIDPSIIFKAHVLEGQTVVAGELVAEVHGSGAALLAGERTALNFLQRMSGIATLTRTFVDAVSTTHTAILDTRKTIPGYRLLDKYAVRMGGGINHRRSLFDMVMVKDNHIDGAGGITPAVQRARAAYPDLPIEVEVRNLDELREALAIEPPLTQIMLDNMSLETMREAVAITAGRVPLEASGNATLKTVAEIAATGVNFISVGALTHSVKALDLSMKIAPEAVAQARTARRIEELKAQLGSKLVILGHHYQREEVIAFADYRGDSLELARQATQTEAKYIVFCGVHFMAEGAAVLARSGQRVLSPDPTAGCCLADTATPAGVQAAWDALDEAFGNADAEFTPITYINSSAALKGFCGQHGGVVCTSGNAEKVLRWALAQRPRVFFFPDQHLARNTALKMGIPAEEMALWNLRRRLSPEVLRATRVLLWPGACNVHQMFRPEHIKAVRERYSGVRVVVHPECKAEVVALADEAGSTSKMLQWISAAPAGSVWAIGTESRLVYRLQREFPALTIVPLADVPPFCPTMGQITAEKLEATLEALVRGDFSNEIKVNPGDAAWAKVALERMLSIK